MTNSNHMIMICNTKNERYIILSKNIPVSPKMTKVLDALATKILNPVQNVQSADCWENSAEFFFFLWSDCKYRVYYFVTLRRVSSIKKEEEEETNCFGLLQSRGSWHKCVNCLGLNDFLGQVTPVSDGSRQEWVLLVLVSAVWLQELVVSSSLTWEWWLKLVLNSIRGNDVVVDSIQHCHCHPSCLCSVLKGGPL